MLPDEWIVLPDDFRDAICALSDAQADAVLVGGFAVAFHGHPRATKDLDVLVRPDPSNAQRAAGRPQDLADVAAFESLAARH